MDKTESTIKGLCERLGVDGWEEAIEWWLGRGEMQLAITRRINIVDDEIGQMEERLTEAERAKRRYMRQQRKALSSRQLELAARRDAVMLLEQETASVAAEVDAGSRMIDRLCCTVEQAFYAVACNRLPAFREALATIYLSSKQAEHPDPTQSTKMLLPASPEQLADIPEARSASRLRRRRTSLLQPGRLPDSDKERLDMVLARFSAELDPRDIEAAVLAAKLAAMADAKKEETEEEAEARRQAGVEAAGLGGDFVADDEGGGGGYRGEDGGKNDDDGKDAGDGDGGGAGDNESQRRHRRALDSLLGSRQRVTAAEAHQMLELLRRGCVPETVLDYLQHVEEITATLSTELAAMKPELVGEAEQPSQSGIEAGLAAASVARFQSSTASLSGCRSDPIGSGAGSWHGPPAASVSGLRSAASSAGLSATLSVAPAATAAGNASMPALPPAKDVWPRDGSVSLGGTAPAGGLRVQPWRRGETAWGQRVGSSAQRGPGGEDGEESEPFMRMGRAWGKPKQLRIMPPSIKRGKARTRQEREAEALKELAAHARQGSELPDSAILRVLRAAKREAAAGNVGAESMSDSEDDSEGEISIKSGAGVTPGIRFRRASISLAPKVAEQRQGRQASEGAASGTGGAVRAGEPPRGRKGSASRGERRGSISLVTETPGMGSLAPAAFFGPDDEQDSRSAAQMAAPGGKLRISTPKASIAGLGYAPPGAGSAPSPGDFGRRTPDSGTPPPEGSNQLPFKSALRRMASGRFGAGGALTPLAAGMRADAGSSSPLLAPGGGTSSSVSVGAPAPSETMAAQMLSSGSKYTGAPRKTVSPLAAAGGLKALERPSRDLVDRAGSSRDLIESLRHRGAGSLSGPAGKGDSAGSASAGRRLGGRSSGGGGRSPAAHSVGSPQGPRAVGLGSPGLVPLGGESSILGIDEDRSLFDGDDADSDEEEAAALLQTMNGASPKSAGGAFGAAQRDRPSRKSLVGGRLPLTNLPRRRFAHARLPTPAETLVVPTPSTADGSRGALFAAGEVERQLAAMERLGARGGGSTQMSPDTQAAARATGRVGGTRAGLQLLQPDELAARPRGELTLVAKPTFHLHRQFHHLPDDPDQPSPMPYEDEFEESMLVSGSGVAAGGTWERRGTFAERGDTTRAGGRGDDDTSLTELAGAITERVRKSREGRRHMPVVHASIDKATGTTTAHRSSRGSARRDETSMELDLGMGSRGSTRASPPLPTSPPRAGTSREGRRTPGPPSRGSSRQVPPPPPGSARSGSRGSSPPHPPRRRDAGVSPLRHRGDAFRAPIESRTRETGSGADVTQLPLETQSPKPAKTNKMKISKAKKTKKTTTTTGNKGQRPRSKARRTRARQSQEAGLSTVSRDPETGLPTSLVGSSADRSAARSDMDYIMGKAAAKHRSAVGAYVRDVDGPGTTSKAARAARRELGSVDWSGGGARLAAAGSRDARAFAVSTSGLGTSKAAQMHASPGSAEGFAASGIAALGRVGATLSSQLVEQDIARLAQAARAKREQQMRDDIALIADVRDGMAPAEQVGLSSQYAGTAGAPSMYGLQSMSALMAPSVATTSALHASMNAGEDSRVIMDPSVTL